MYKLYMVTEKLWIPTENLPIWLSVFISTVSILIYLIYIMVLFHEKVS